MKKVYLKVEYGSRGEMEFLGLVETSKNEIELELKKIVDNCEDEDEKDYYEELYFVEENVEKGVIEVGVSEEESYCYNDYEMNKERVDELLEIDKLCEEGKMDYIEGNNRIDELLYDISYDIL